MKISLKSTIAGITFAIGSMSHVQAAVVTESFEGAFPAWESNWFGTFSNARNDYCDGLRNCTQRGNNPDGLWIADTSNGNTVNVIFDSAFGESLVSFKLDVAGYSNTTLSG